MDQLSLLMQLAGAVADLIDIQGSSVLVCLENGWDTTAQVILAYLSNLGNENLAKVPTVVTHLDLCVSEQCSLRSTVYTTDVAIM